MKMRNTLLAGAALAVAAVVAVLIGDVLAWRTDQTILIGLATGGVLGLAVSGGPFWRLAGFLIGFAVTWVIYPLRAGYLPDSSSGRAVAAVLAILVITGLIALSFGRIPLAAGLVGMAAMAGAYETTFTASPPDVLSTSPTWATSVLLTTAIGFAATVWFGAGDAEPDKAQPVEFSTSSAGE
jgi:prepilin signal peptidase PulO-like enzyme (type II secretory pathway)